MKNLLKYFILAASLAPPVSSRVSELSTAPTTFTFEIINPPGAIATTLLGINDAGQVVGSYTTTAGRTPFLRSADGTIYTTIAVPGETPGQTTANAINDDGQVVGSFSDSAGTHGYIRSAEGKTYTTIDYPGAPVGSATTALGINNAGDVVGVVSYGGFPHGFLRRPDGAFTAVDVPGSSGTSPGGISNGGVIAGFYFTNGSGGPKRSFVRNMNTQNYVSFEMPGAAPSPTVVNTINDSGTLVGYFADQGFSCGDALCTPLQVPGSNNQTVAWGINNRGQVVGTDASGDGFIATPIAQSSNPAIRTNAGVLTSGAFGGMQTICPGTWIEIYGSNLASTATEWQTSDFSDNIAPTSLGGVSVSIGGEKAYVAYTSPGQVNALVPDGIDQGAVQITVTNGDHASAPYTATVSAVQPGLLTIGPTFSGAGNSATTFVAGLHSDYATYALPVKYNFGVISKPATPGDTIVFYGVGFGPTLPTLPPGSIANQPTTLAGSLQITIGNQPAVVTYAGLAPGSVGLYQFNVVIPGGLVPSDFTPVSFTLNGIRATQLLWLSVQ